MSESGDEPMPVEERGFSDGSKLESSDLALRDELLEFFERLGDGLDAEVKEEVTTSLVMFAAEIAGAGEDVDSSSLMNMRYFERLQNVLIMFAYGWRLGRLGLEVDLKGEFDRLLVRVADRVEELEAGQ